MNHVRELRVLDADLRLRMIAAPTSIANQSRKFHGSMDHSIEVFPLATQTNEAAFVILKRRTTSVIVAIISFLGEMSATKQPMSIEVTTWAIAMP